MDGLEDFEIDEVLKDIDCDGCEEATDQSTVTFQSTSDGTNSQTRAEVTPPPTLPYADANSFSQPGGPLLTGRPAIKLYLSCDPDSFSAYQVTIRQSIELFEAQPCDVESNAQGRNHPITLGQVGIRCRFCNFIPPSERTRGSTYYPSKLSGLYQAAQNLAVTHLMQNCPVVPRDVRECLNSLRDKKSAAGGGKHAWADRAGALGVFEDEHGLRFTSRLDAVTHH